jgi:hypothetical protein
VAAASAVAALLLVMVLLLPWSNWSSSSRSPTLCTHRHEHGCLCCVVGQRHLGCPCAALLSNNLQHECERR